MKNLKDAVISSIVMPELGRDFTFQVECDSLTAVCAFPSVRHAYQPFLVNLPPSDILVLKLPTVDTGPTSTISSRDVSALNHELVNDPMEK